MLLRYIFRPFLSDFVHVPKHMRFKVKTHLITCWLANCYYSWLLSQITFSRNVCLFVRNENNWNIRFYGRVFIAAQTFEHVFFSIESKPDNDFKTSFFL